MRRPCERVSPNCLRNARSRTVEHACSRLGGDVPRTQTGATGREDERHLIREVLDGLRDRLPVVRHEPPDDLEALGLEQLLQEITAEILPRALRDSVRDGEDAGRQTSSFVFSTRRTSSITIALSIALAMS